MSLLIIISCIALLMLLITWGKVNPFFAFLIVSIVAGLFLGIPIETLPKTVQKGLGDMLGSLAIIIIFGTCLGKLTAETGAAEVIANKLIYWTGEKNIQIGLMIAGLLIGIPLFYSIGFVLMIPLVFTLAKQYNLPAVPMALPMLSSLSVAHGFLPPHPSPVALVTQLNANMALTLIYGLVLAIPCILIAGLFYSKKLYFIKAQPITFESNTPKNSILPTFSNSLLTALLPVFILAITFILKIFIHDPYQIKIIDFIGDPSVLMIISLIIATYTLGIRLGISMKTVMSIYTEGVKDIAIILLIMGGAGAFKEVLMVAGVDKTIVALSNSFVIHPYLLGWIIAACIRLMIGSATVAGLMAVTIVVPIVTNNTQINPNLMVLAIGAGSLIGSHINDPGFWLFKEYFNISVKDTLKSWTMMESLVSVVGIIGIYILDFFI